MRRDTETDNEEWEDEDEEEEEEEKPKKKKKKKKSSPEETPDETPEDENPQIRIVSENELINMKIDKISETLQNISELLTKEK